MIYLNAKYLRYYFLEGETAFIIDVEGGKVVHNHELPFHITTIRWCSSQYEHSLNEVTLISVIFYVEPQYIHVSVFDNSPDSPSHPIFANKQSRG